jgi:hypothetical protein
MRDQYFPLNREYVQGPIAQPTNEGLIATPLPIRVSNRGDSWRKEAMGCARGPLDPMKMVLCPYFGVLLLSTELAIT